MTKPALEAKTSTPNKKIPVNAKHFWDQLHKFNLERQEQGKTDSQNKSNIEYRLSRI